MKRKIRLIAICLLFALSTTTLSGCHKKQTFEEYAESIFLNEITANTLNLHYTLENPKAYGITKYDISLGTYSPSGEETAKALQQMESELLSFSYDSLTREEKLTYDLLEDFLDTQLQFCKYPLYDEPLSFSNGMQMQLPILLAEYEFNTEQDVKDYLELITLVDEYLKDIIEFEKEKAKAGLFMSDSLCEAVIDSCEAFLENQEEHYFLVTFENRVKKLDLSKKKTNAYIKSNEEVFAEEIVPAYENMIKELTKLLGSGTNEGGLCNFPDGKKYYELLVYSETGMDDSVEEIWEKIETQRLKDLLVCADIQETNPSIFDQIDALEWEMEDPDSMLSLLQENMLSDFPKPPSTDYTIHYVNPALEDYLAPAFYIVAPIDNYTENAIYINDADQSSDIYYFTTLAHEGFPGHLYQTVMSYEYKMMPLRSILNYSGFTEGWATYIEMMSYYYAGLEDDVASMLAHNQAATLSLYATSDIGLHYYGWSASDMYEFWSSFGISNEEVIEQITQLILAEPGNYLKYYVGYLGFLELKDYAKSEFKENFSTKEFHRAILDIGPAPFYIIEDYLEKYYSAPQT